MRADALVVAAGAGMGVDSGLPDFRGPEGFWRAYPPYKTLGLAFEDLANPRWFTDDPSLAWGFYGHRLNLYRATTPHDGFTILRTWSERMKHGAFVFTSNVDGHFGRAGFARERICEVHGAIDTLQCTTESCRGLWPAPPGHRVVDVDEATFRARPPFPNCPRCGALARPNILMFGDWSWDDTRTDEQHHALQEWTRSIVASLVANKVVVVECGAGTAIPTVRAFSERLWAQGATLVRINVRESQIPTRLNMDTRARTVESTTGASFSVAAGALETLRAIDAHMSAD